jgi:Ricin-type beta-trefoil lectin domain
MGPIYRRLFSGLTSITLAMAGVAAFPPNNAAAATATTVVAQHSGMCLDVRGGPQATQDGAVIEQWHCTGATNQNWTLEDMGSGRFRLVAQNSGKCIETIGGGTANTTGLQQWTCNGTSRQLWTRRSTSTPGAYLFVHVDSNRCLDVPQSSMVEGELLIIYDCRDGQNQRWAISSAYPPPAEPLVAKHSGKCLDVRGGPQATQDGAVIEQWQCTGATNQSWTLRDAGSGQVQLVALNSGKCVQPVGGGTANTTGLEQRTCDSAATTQRWIRQSTATAGEYNFVHVPSNRCIDIQQSGLTDGTLALLFDCRGTANQTWTVGAPAQSPPTVSTVNGEYWALPSRYPAKSPYGGLYQIWGQAITWSPTTDLHWVGAYWRDLNPTEGQYRWDRLESINGTFTYSLNQLAAQGKTALIWTSLFNKDNNTVWPWHAPKWVVDKCAAAGTPVKVVHDLDANNQPVDFGLALWQPCPRREVLRFITEMFSRYRTDSRVEYAYATTFNSGEFWMPADVYNDAVANAGFSPSVLQSFATDVIDAWATAVGVKKVIWTSAGNWSLPGAGTAAPDAVNDYALQTLGTQLREGNGESVMAGLSQPRIGQETIPVVPTPVGAQTGEYHYYLTSPTIHEMGRDGLDFYGNEFEIASKAGVFGNYDYYRMTVLNMLRKGHNWAIFPHDLRTGTNDTAYPQFAALRDYFRQSAGYPVAESPDAWAVLQMFHDDCWNGTRFYHNYEKFLLQRDVDSGGRTIPVERRTWDPQQYGFCTVGSGGATEPAVTDFARRTDRASGNNYIYFDVDSRFAPATEQQFRIAVTYRDTGTNSWRLEYSTATSAIVATPNVTNTNSGTLKTAIFQLSDASFRGAQAGGMDFRIYNGGAADVTIRSVRVIRGGP